ncbi:MAG: hypothetical protein H6559_21515 [Lewinellaceae bacterium]|nr:hypothetical protein [Lewinellaceae bacterium]
MDHILKFHPFGFSWRNLELIPEIILINKEPNLRSFIGDLITFLSNTFLRVTITGVNQFKFYNKVANELKYISKISDISSAAFNFTLDESLLIKRHYKKKLEEIKTHYFIPPSPTTLNMSIRSALYRTSWATSIIMTKNMTTPCFITPMPPSR